MKIEIKKILYKFLQDGISSDDAVQQILDLFSVSISEADSKNDKSTYFDTIKKGFSELQEDFSEVGLDSFWQKEDIPDEASREDLGGEFTHQYSLTHSDGYDEASYWGDIYLPLSADLYMRFNVIG